MNYKVITIISIFLIFIFSFLYHNIYVYFPNTFTSLLFPVNESIFEHMKLIYLSYLSSAVIEYFLLKKNKLNINNFKMSILFSIVFNIVFFLIVYTLIYINTSHSLFITLLSYFISICLSKSLSYLILTSNKDYSFINKYFYIIIFIIFLILIYFTYNPPKNLIFIDKENKKIGLSNYY
ncbi:MAG: hypothetical protein IJ105_04905 [Bacilli bacterium]|nr:hypothetical protein [Bacilli bacterium]